MHTVCLLLDLTSLCPLTSVFSVAVRKKPVWAVLWRKSLCLSTMFAMGHEALTTNCSIPGSTLNQLCLLHSISHLLRQYIYIYIYFCHICLLFSNNWDKLAKNKFKKLEKSFTLPCLTSKYQTVTAANHQRGCTPEFWWFCCLNLCSQQQCDSWQNLIKTSEGRAVHLCLSLFFPCVCSLNA